MAAPPSTSEQKASVIQRLLSGETALLFLLTGVSYFAVYVYEAGYCNYFGVPMMLINVELSTVLLFSITAFLVLPWIAYATTIYPLMEQFLTRRQNPMFRALIHGLPFFFAAVALWMIKAQAITYVFAVVTAIFMTTMASLSARRDNAERQQANAELPRFLPPSMHRSLIRFGVRQTWIIPVVIWAGIGVFFLNALGRNNARRQRYFLMTNRDGPALVVRAYNTQLICVRLGEGTKTCSGEFFFVNSTNTLLKFENRRVGPVHPPPGLRR